MRHSRVATLVAALLLVSVGCTQRSEAGQTNTLVHATPGPESAQSSPPQDVQQVQVAINDGDFKDDVYSAQIGATVFMISANGGPYTLSVENVIEQFPVHAGSSRLEANLATPGTYTMRLAETGARAILNIRPVGGR